jgi:Protein of unknown function (DUF2950)
MKTLISFGGTVALMATQLLLTPNAQAQKTFDTPDAAAQALIDAAANNDTARLAEIFGPQGRSLLTSGNPDQDKAERLEFAGIAKGKHELQQDSMNSDRMILSVGAEDWPYPVPLVRTDGKWSFDSSMGQMSMQARRIGADELDAIEVCAGYVGMQEEYAKKHDMREYSRTIEGLSGFVPKEFVDAAGSHPKPYHGYYYAALKAQGANAPGGQSNYVDTKAPSAGFALVAWPAEYGVSGVHTFIVSQDGVVYEKDMGWPAKTTAPPLKRYDPDPTWAPVNQ